MQAVSEHLLYLFQSEDDMIKLGVPRHKTTITIGDG